jgi:hypothetical protein
LVPPNPSGFSAPPVLVDLYDAPVEILQKTGKILEARLRLK